MPRLSLILLILAILTTAADSSPACKSKTEAREAWPKRYIAYRIIKDTVWEVTRDPQHIHPTQKPVELARRAIMNSSKPGEIVLDPFLGSGATLIGAELTKRRCLGIELDPVYAQAAIERWEKFTGKKAIHLGSGNTLSKARRENATGHSGVTVPRYRRRGATGTSQEIREGGDVGQPEAGGESVRESSVVAGDS